MPAAQARADLKRKITLERRLAKEIRAFNKKMVQAVVRTFNLGSMVFNAQLMEPDLVQILNEHYEDVGSKFDDQITRKLPKDIAATSNEGELIAAALLTFFALRSRQQASIITATNQRNIDQSIARSFDIAQAEAIAGRPRTRIENAIQAGTNLNRLLARRVTGISALETQAVAEAAKATEVEVLTFQQPSVTGGQPGQRLTGLPSQVLPPGQLLPDPPLPITKTWFSAGDERVRQDHVLADGQVVDMSEPFIVGGQSLRWPGDSGLGATPGNIINCRCGSISSVQGIVAERRRVGQATTFETEVSEQLLVSIGV